MAIKIDFDEADSTGQLGIVLPKVPALPARPVAKPVIRPTVVKPTIVRPALKVPVRPAVKRPTVVRPTVRPTTRPAAPGLRTSTRPSRMPGFAPPTPSVRVEQAAPQTRLVPAAESTVDVSLPSADMDSFAQEAQLPAGGAASSMPGGGPVEPMAEPTFEPEAEDMAAETAIVPVKPATPAPVVKKGFPWFAVGGIALGSLLLITVFRRKPVAR